MTKYLLIAVHLSAFAFLALCIYLQINDPDPLPWILVYGVCAAVPLLSLVDKNPIILSLIALALCMFALAISVEGLVTYMGKATEEPLMQPMNEEKPFIEEAREFIGVFIAFLIVLAYALRDLKNKNKTKAV